APSDRSPRRLRQGRRQLDGLGARPSPHGQPRLLQRICARSRELPRTGALVRLDRPWRPGRRDVETLAGGPERSLSAIVAWLASGFAIPSATTRGAARW